MDPNENRIRKIVLERLGACRVCHRAHDGDDVHVISQNPDVWMMVVECPDCHTRSFVAAVVDEKQADQAQIALRRLAGEHNLLHPVDGASDNREISSPTPEPLTDDDVSGMHEFLETFNGDFKRLFAKG
jgi:hypothetical protein